MRMYVWSVKPKWLAVAHASSVAEARDLLLSQDQIGESGDGPCVVRETARKYVTEHEPTHWMGPNGEFALTSSAELEEQEEYSRVLYALAVDLATALKELLPDGWGEDDVMDHLPGVKLARLALQSANGKIGYWVPNPSCKLPADSAPPEAPPSTTAR